MSDQTSIKTQSEKDKLFSRSLFYQVLSVLLRHPSHIERPPKEETSRWLAAVTLLETAKKERFKAALRLLIEELNNTKQSEWIRQYEACLGHTAHGIVPSYELEYGETQSLREPQQLSDLAAFYHAFGLKVNEKIHERVDHISVECEFMNFLTFKEAYALKQGWREKGEICHLASRRFLFEHLGRWAPSFALRLLKFAKEGVMAHVADFTLSFIVQDCQRQGVIPGPNDLPIRSVIEKVETGCATCSLEADLPDRQDFHVKEK